MVLYIVLTHSHSTRTVLKLIVTTHTNGHFTIDDGRPGAVKLFSEMAWLFDKVELEKLETKNFRYGFGLV